MTQDGSRWIWVYIWHQRYSYRGWIGTKGVFHSSSDNNNAIATSRCHHTLPYVRVCCTMQQCIAICYDMLR